MNTNIFLKEHTCPWWLGAGLDHPLRRWLHNPAEILKELAGPGDTVLDVGCGIGYFTLGLAQRVGENGQVIAADLQPEMLAATRQRAERAGLLSRIRFHQSTPEKIGISEPMDAALAFWMVHEVRQRQDFLNEIYNLLKPGGKFLIVEPKLHVRENDFEFTRSLVKRCGFRQIGQPAVRFSRAILSAK